ncbi:MAG: secondary thiamine-phosphate synthase [Deltaproteobacteria bacterium]|nr:secondary thiamine-phosphate synthase [Deltaproteobacteria bacterium]HCH62054.1 secondary thiamine-phosphate synthase [Deltaproteobacteria bacterium]
MHRVQLTLTTRRGLQDITAAIAEVVGGSGVRDGLCHVFLHHTSASLVIQENADTDVLHDLERFLSRLVPDGDRLWTHVEEGPDDMPAHVKAALTATSLTLPVTDGQMDLGTWQGIFLWEHRLHPLARRVTVSVFGG